MHYKQRYLKSFTFIAFLLTFLTDLYGQTNNQEFAWVKNINNGNQYNNVRVSSTTDKDGYVYVTGVTYTDLHYNVTNQLLTQMGWQDAFILKIAGDGQVVWSKQFAYPNAQSQARGMDVVVDDKGNVYIVGQFHATIDFNPDPSASHTVTSAGIWDAFVCKLDINGNFEWLKTWGKTGGRDFADHVAIGPSGSVYVSGSFGDNLDLNPGSGVEMAYATGAPNPNHPNNPVIERFLCKLDASGNYLWGIHFEEGLILNGDNTNSLGLTVDRVGNAYIAGTFRNSLAFPAGSGMQAIPPIGEMDMYIVKVSNIGNFVWTKSFGGPGTDILSDLKADEEDNLYITGAFGRTADLDPNRSGKYFTSTGGSVYYDAFVLKINTDGDYIWANTFGSSNHDNGLAVAIDQSGNVYATGSFKDSVNFVPGSNRREDNIISNGIDYDIFVVKLDAEGNYEWSRSMGGASQQATAGTGPDCGDEISIDPSGNIYVTGYFRDTVDFNQGNTPKAELHASDGNMFLLKYGEVCDILVPVINVNGFILGTAGSYSTYQWLLNGSEIPGATDSTYTVETNGNYQVRVTDTAGCSSISAIYQVLNYTDIKDAFNQPHQVKVYPNPTTDRIYITSPAAVDVSLYNLHGRLLLKAQDPSYIELEKMAGGIYILQVTNQEGQLIKVEKVVKE